MNDNEGDKKEDQQTTSSSYISSAAFPTSAKVIYVRLVALLVFLFVLGLFLYTVDQGHDSEDTTETPGEIQNN